MTGQGHPGSMDPSQNHFLPILDLLNLGDSDTAALQQFPACRPLGIVFSTPRNGFQFAKQKTASFKGLQGLI